MPYAIYKSETGPIERMVSADLSQMPLQPSPGELCAWMDSGDDLTHYILNGLPTALPEKPVGDQWQFNYAEGTWFDPRSIEEFRTLRLSQLKAERYQKLTSGFTAIGHRFDSNEQSILNINSKTPHAFAAKMLNGSFSTTWTLEDNSVITLDADQMIAVAMALSNYGESIYETYRELKEAIESVDAESPSAKADIESVKWPPDTTPPQ